MTLPQSKYRRQLVLFLAAVGLIVILAAAVSWQNARLARAAAQETLPFNHKAHVGAGAQCVFCHPGTLYGPVASIPSTAKCMGCHANVQVREAAQPSVDVVVQHWESDQPLQWVKTFDLPDFVYFSHQPHIAAGVACESCHGDVENRVVLEQTTRFNMGFCLGCHRDQTPDKVKRLESCSTCHQ